MYRLNYTQRFLRNIAIAIVSTIWVLPFYVFLGFIVDFLRIQEKLLFDAEYPEGWSFSYIEMSDVFLTITLALFMITIFFWAFVVANRLWPLKK